MKKCVERALNGTRFDVPRSSAFQGLAVSTITGTNATLDPGQTCTISVTYASLPGSSSDTLSS
jgi:hypothetical protein